MNYENIGKNLLFAERVFVSVCLKDGSDYFGNVVNFGAEYLCHKRTLTRILKQKLNEISSTQSLKPKKIVFSIKFYFRLKFFR